MKHPLILQCSPRRGGNSAHAAELVQRVIQRHCAPHTGNGNSKITRLDLADYSISPCIGCDLCAKPQNHTAFFWGCPLAPKDDSEPLFKALFQASTLYIISPIYHYHLPAQAKALLDRLQPFYWMQQGKVPYPAEHSQARHYFPLFIAGQERGQKLFEGSLLTLRYSFQATGFSSSAHLGLRGLDPKNALQTNPESQRMVEEFIERTINQQAPLPPHEEQ